MATLSLSIPKAFGKTLLAEQVQKFVIKAMASAWDQGYETAHRDHCDYMPDEVDDDVCDVTSPNPYWEEVARDDAE